ncbi:MAG: hypothetical protein ACRD96_22715, partial [Bryobacteraceae bacterium]
MAKARKKKPEIAADTPKPRRWLGALLLFFAVVVFYWMPLNSATTSIQWDAVDVHYSSMRYFADHLRAGDLPFWTPYIFSGYPFLADPQVAAWYPLHWPFYLLGITPGAIQFILALHALIACGGAWLLASRLGLAPAVAAFAYGFSGFFAGHSSHLGIFTAAALLPWLLLAYLRAVEDGSLADVALAGLAGGLLVLCGHFQTALYSFAALAMFALSMFALAMAAPRRWKRIAWVLPAVVALALALSAIATLPGLELASHSIRARSDYSSNREGALPPKALLTLVAPNALGALSGQYRGPEDITQYYFYGGLLLLPLAALSYKVRRARWIVLALVVPALWYSFGPAGGLYHLGRILPGFHKVRAPAHAWFVVALGLA